MVKTNIGLAEYAKKALQEKWGYVRGTFGYILTMQLFQEKLKQYPGYVEPFKNFILNNWIGKRTADCVGLIKSYIWHNDGKITYNPATDVNADTMFRLAKKKGTIGTIPEILGLCVYKKGHIGVYIGNGQVIESRGTKYGVVQTPLRGGNANTWTHWLKCPYIEYKEAKKLDWKEIIKKVANNPEQWEKAINAAVNIAKAEGDIGDLEIFKYLPNLIEKIYNRG